MRRGPWPPGRFSSILNGMSRPRPIFRRCLLGAALCLLLVGLLAAGLWLLRERLLQELLRPLLVRELSRRWQIEAVIGRLQLDNWTLEAQQLRFERAGLGRLDLERLQLSLDWQAMSDRHLQQLVLVRPRLTLPKSAPAPTARAGAWPQGPPLTIDRIEIREGEILLPGKATRLWQVAALGTLGRQWSLEAQLQSGADPGQRLALQARGSWNGALRAEVGHLAWQARELLGTPLRLTLLDGDLIEFSGSLQLTTLTDAELRPLLEALGRPLPATPPWRLEKLDLKPSLLNAAFRLEGSLGSLLIGTDGSRPLLRKATLTAHADTAGPWNFAAAAQLGPARDPVVLAGSLTRAPTPALELTRLDWRGEGLLAEPLRFSLADGNTGLTASLQLTELSDAALRPLLALADIRLPAAAQWSLRDLTLAPAWDGSRWQLQLVAGSGSLHTADRKLAVGHIELAVAGHAGDWQLNGEARIGAKNRLHGRLRLHEELLDGQASLELPDLASLDQLLPGIGLPALHGTASLSAGISGRSDQPSFAVSAKLRELTLPDTAGLPRLELQAEALVAQRQETWLLSAGSLSGALSGQWGGTLAGSFTGRLGSNGWSLQVGELQGNELSWTAQDGLSVYAGGRLTLHGNVGSAGGAPVGIDLQGELAGGELLYGAYYLPLQSISARFDLQGDVAAGTVHLQRAALLVPQLGELDLDGELGREESRWNATLELPDLQQALDSHGRKLLGESFPRTKDLALAGGLRIAATGSRRRQGWNLQLRFKPRQISLDWGERIHLAGLQGEVPLQLGSAGENETQPGRLAWTHLACGPVTAGPGELATRSRPGQLQLPGELHLGLAGGELLLADLELTLPPQELEIASRLTVAAVELQALTGELGWPEMRGGFSAELGRLHYRDGELGSAGTAEIDVFGGQIRVGQMRLREPFSRYPVFQADIDFSGIDLYRLTNTFAFGEMNGVIDGHVHQLNLFGVTPTRFEAALKTRNSGTRNISVKALNNLTILSQGGLSAALSRGIYQFIDFYRYRSIGIACSLENDLFRMHGTAREGSDRYLVYGAFLPPRIDIVTSSPTVSFKEMVKRLKRIERPGSSGTSR